MVIMVIVVIHARIARRPLLFGPSNRWDRSFTQMTFGIRQCQLFAGSQLSSSGTILRVRISGTTHPLCPFQIHLHGSRVP